MTGEFFYGMPSETLEIYFYIPLPFISGWIEKRDMDWLPTLETKDRLITWPTYYKENWSHSFTWFSQWPRKEVIISHRMKSIASWSGVDLSLGYLNFNPKFDGFFKWFEFNEAAEKSILKSTSGNVCHEGSW